MYYYYSVKHGVGQITRWVGSRQIDMRAHGTQKTKTKAMCSHKNTNTWPGKKSPAMCKTGHEHAAIWENSSATYSHKTWQHESTQARGQKSVRPSELETAHSHKETERGAQVSEPRHETETQDMSAGIRTPRSNMKQGTQTRDRTLSSTRAHSKPRAHIKSRHDGSIRALSQNHD